MAFKVLAIHSLLLAALAVACGDGSEPPCYTPAGPTPEEGRLAGFSIAHNQARASATPAPSPPVAPLAWDEDIAGIAQGWADCLASRGCALPLEHNPNRGHLGENLYWGFGTPATAGEVTQAWADEGACYSYADNTCDTVACPFSCGHYTQLVWRDTARFGCGVADCEGDNGEVWVCDYAPPGNVNGQRPY